jgi:hypothetical protein
MREFYGTLEPEGAELGFEDALKRVFRTRSEFLSAMSRLRLLAGDRAVEEADLLRLRTKELLDRIQAQHIGVEELESRCAAVEHQIAQFIPQAKRAIYLPTS